MSIFLKLYFALLIAVLLILFYGMALRPKSSQLTTSVHSEKISSSESVAVALTGTEADPMRKAAPQLDDYFKEAAPNVPEDDKMGPMGTCPPSKPFSTDLPLANVPLCMAKSQQNMRLSAAAPTQKMM